MDGYAVQTAVIQNTAVPIHRALCQHVGFQTGGDQPGKRDAELELADVEFLADVLFQQIDLTGTVAGYPEETDLARAFQPVEGLGDFLGLHQRIWAVQQKNVQIVRVQPPQDTIHGCQDVVPG